MTLTDWQAGFRLMLAAPEDRAAVRRENNLTRGVAPEDIEPDTGYDLSRRAYDQVRAEWRELVATDGWDEFNSVTYQRAYDYWAARRPEWTEDDDWIGDLIR